MDSKQLARTANKVHGALLEWWKQRVVPHVPVPDMDDLTASVERMRTLVSKGMFHAGEQARKASYISLRELMSKLYAADHVLKQPLRSPPALRDICLDLCSIQEEFGDLEWDDEGRLCVTTEPIELEDVYLGPFQIALSLHPSDSHDRPFRYSCIAEDPHPAARGGEYTHPHVSAERLCEGEGSLAISNALREGRLFDFYTLVRSTLETYASDSPYVRLDEWEGEACDECGHTISSHDDTYRCDRCDVVLCDECSEYCEGCGRTFCKRHMDHCERCGARICPECGEISTCKECGRSICDDCRVTCGDCGDDVCERCSGKCSDCEGTFCPACLTGCEGCGNKICDECSDEDGLCSACHDERENDESDETESDETGEPAEPVEHPGQMRFFQEGQEAA